MMPYVKPLTLSDAPEKSKPILKAINDNFGQSLNIFSTAAYQPDILGGMTQINEGIRNDLPEKFRELAYFMASQINQCGYCSHYHKQAARQAGLSEEQLSAVENYQASDKFDDQEKAVLSYSEQLTKNAKVDRNVIDELKIFLNEKQMVSLAGTVALANFTNRFNHGLDIQLP
jgi:uncharacterized peroxidase-related enzyme